MSSEPDLEEGRLSDLSTTQDEDEPQEQKGQNQEMANSQGQDITQNF